MLRRSLGVSRHLSSGLAWGEATDTKRSPNSTVQVLLFYYIITQSTPSSFIPFRLSLLLIQPSSKMVSANIILGLVAVAGSAVATDFTKGNVYWYPCG